MSAFIRQPCDESFIRARPALTAGSRSFGRWVLIATIFASSMAFIDGTVVNVALPALQKDLNATVIDVQWVIEAYSLFLAALLLVGGSLGDRYGRRRVFLIGVTTFAAASGWCGLVPGIVQLIVARAVQGIGAALLVPGSLAIISSSFPEEQRGRAIGTWSGFSAITAAIGPVLGGWLIEHVSWRAVFFINIPLALVVIGISLWRVPESANDENEGLDWFGAILGALGLGALIYGLIESSRLGFAHPAMMAAFIAAVVILSVFLVWEARTHHPMLSLSLFRSRTFTGANLLTFLLYGALGGTLFFLPLNLIQVQHYPPTAAGAALLPFIVIMFLLSRWSGGLVAKYGPRIPLVTGPLIAATGFALFMVPGTGGSYWTTFFPAAVVLGLGMAVSVAPLTTTVMNSIAQNRVGIASGINNAVSRAAGLLAIAILGIVMLHAFNHALDRQLRGVDLTPAARESLQDQRSKLAGVSLPEEMDGATRQEIGRAIDQSFVHGFRLIMGIGAMLAIASGVSAFTLIGPLPNAEKFAK
ncbi:MAG: MFS transporter [Chthoniobacterales bacterium]|nr:MAG: MFS transporter [Chthoniobacterales bacterium]